MIRLVHLKQKCIELKPGNSIHNFRHYSTITYIDCCTSSRGLETLLNEKNLSINMSFSAESNISAYYNDIHDLEHR